MLSTERCTLCNLCESDFSDAVKLFTDEQVRKYLGGAISQEQAYDKLYRWINNNEDLYFCVRFNLTNDFIGIVSVSPHHDSRTKELSYQFLPDWWGRGIAKETLRGMLAYLKGATDIEELLAETQSLNMRSCRLLENLGFEIFNTVQRFGAEQRIYKIIL